MLTTFLIVLLVVIHFVGATAYYIFSRLLNSIDGGMGSAFGLPHRNHTKQEDLLRALVWEVFLTRDLVGMIRDL